MTSPPPVIPGPDQPYSVADVMGQQPTTAFPPRRPWAIIGGAAVLALLVGAGAYLFLRGRDDPPAASSTGRQTAIIIGGSCTQLGQTATTSAGTQVRCIDEDGRRQWVDPDPPKPATFHVAGTMTLTDDDARWTPARDCSGTGGYDDIRDGAQVVVTDAGGRTVGIGRLIGGVASSRTRCEFTFLVPDVPTGHGFYGVEVTHRGVVEYSEADLEAGAAALSLGD